MSSLIITTVGTSLLINKGWRRGDSFPEQKELLESLKNADLERVSAETNTLHNMGIDKQDKIVFLYSDTPEGKYCAEVLQQLFANKQQRRELVETRELTALNYKSKSFAQTGLKALVSETITLVRDAETRGLTPVFCATGGFKAEIAFLNLLGALLNIEVYYIHDLFREIIRLPRLPLSWNTEWVINHRDFFDWIDEQPRKSVEVENRLKAYPELESLVEPSDDGYTYLNPVGNLLYKASQLDRAKPILWPDPDPRLPEQKSQVSRIEHHRPNGWEIYVNKLCQLACVSVVAYDDNAYGGDDLKIGDADQGTIFCRFGEARNCLPLRVETTAKGEQQTKLVLEHIKRKL